jgi:hypothetical protein
MSWGKNASPLEQFRRKQGSRPEKAAEGWVHQHVGESWLKKYALISGSTLKLFTGERKHICEVAFSLNGLASATREKGNILVLVIDQCEVRSDGSERTQPPFHQYKTMCPLNFLEHVSRLFSHLQHKLKTGDKMDATRWEIVLQKRITEEHSATAGADEGMGSAGDALRMQGWLDTQATYGSQVSDGRQKKDEEIRKTESGMRKRR